MTGIPELILAGTAIYAAIWWWCVLWNFATALGDRRPPWKPTSPNPRRVLDLHGRLPAKPLHNLDTTKDGA